MTNEEYREALRDFALKSAVNFQQMADTFNQLAKAFAVTSTNWVEAMEATNTSLPEWALAEAKYFHPSDRQFNYDTDDE